MLRDYAGRVAVITGAARGLGRALAIELAARKAHLALIDIDAEALLCLKNELASDRITITHHVADVASPHEIERAAREIAATHLTINLLINNVAISASASFANVTPAAFDRIVQVNFLGAVTCTHVFLPLLQRNAEAQILNVSSCFAWTGYPRKTAYASSKAALRAFSESLRAELDGVGVTVLYPGPLPTTLASSGISDSPTSLERESGSSPPAACRRNASPTSLSTVSSPTPPASSSASTTTSSISSLVSLQHSPPA